MTAHDPTEDRDLTALAERLERERPLPSPAFRGDLGRHLDRLVLRGYSRPARLRLWIAANASSGAGLLALATAGVLGIGPLAS